MIARFTFLTTFQRSVLILVWVLISGIVVAENKQLTKLTNITELKWQHRIIVINNVNNHATILNLLKRNAEEINERDIVWFLLNKEEVFSNYQNPIGVEFSTNLRNQYQLESSQVILIGKDGRLKSRYNGLALTGIFSEIDAMPMRRAEIQNKQ